MPSNSKNKLRFLFVSSDKFPPYRVDVSVLFGKELMGRGHEVDWILQSEQDCEQGYITEWNGSNVWVGRTDLGASRFSRFRKNLFAIFHDMKLFKLTRTQHYDFIQVKDKFVAAIAAVIAAKRNRIPFVYWLSFPFPESSLYAVRSGAARYPFFYYIRGLSLKFLLYRIILPAADYIFVQSEQMKRDIMDMGISGNKMTAVPMGISLESFPARTGLDPNSVSDTKSILYLGTMARVRKIDFVLRVFKNVLDSVPDASLVMVGGSENPDDVKALNDEANNLDISDRVTFTGILPHNRALEYVQKAAICLSPFYPTPILNSTSPTKLVEYMAMAKPVVANDHPEQKLVIEESGAGFCVAYDEMEFAQAIIKLVLNPEKARKMGYLGRDYVTKHRTYQRIADMVEDEYMRILGRSRFHNANTSKVA